MGVRIVSWENAGLVVRQRRKGPFSIAYGEILTAERLSGPRRSLSRPDTTQGYTDDLELDDLADVLAEVAADRHDKCVVRTGYRIKTRPRRASNRFHGGGGF